MSEPTLDVHDPDIRAMVLRNHQPEEAWSLAGKLQSVHCGTCYQPWPCPSYKAAKEADQITVRFERRSND